MCAMWRVHGKPGGPEAGLVAKPYTLKDARDREAALSRMSRALSELEIEGFPTNVSFQRALVAHPGVREGRFHTRWLEGWLDTASLDTASPQGVAAP